MPSLPWVKWFPSDWASEPFLSMCDIATQGVWMNAVNAMMLTGQPRLAGTLDELCKPCRCRRMQLEAALAEIKSKNVGNVYEQNGNTIIECRRLLREHKIRNLRSKAGKISAFKKQHNTQHGAPTSSAYASASDSLEDGGVGEDCPIELPPGFPKTADDAIRQGSVGGHHGLFITDVWNKAVSRGGCDAKGQPIRSFPHYLAIEAKYERERAAKPQFQTNGYQKPTKSIIDKEIDSLTKGL